MVPLVAWQIDPKRKLKRTGTVTDTYQLPTKYYNLDYLIIFLHWLGTARRVTGCDRWPTNSSDHCGFGSQRPTSVRPRRSGNRPIFLLDRPGGRVG